MNQDAFGEIAFAKKLFDQMNHKVNQTNGNEQIHQGDAHIRVFFIPRKEFEANSGD